MGARIVANLAPHQWEDRTRVNQGDASAMRRPPSRDPLTDGRHSHRDSPQFTPLLRPPESCSTHASVPFRTLLPPAHSEHADGLMIGSGTRPSFSPSNSWSSTTLIPAAVSVVPATARLKNLCHRGIAQRPTDLFTCIGAACNGVAVEYTWSPTIKGGSTMQRIEETPGIRPEKSGCRLGSMSGSTS